MHELAPSANRWHLLCGLPHHLRQGGRHSSSSVSSARLTRCWRLLLLMVGRKDWPGTTASDSRHWGSVTGTRSRHTCGSSLYDVEMKESHMRQLWNVSILSSLSLPPSPSYFQLTATAPGNNGLGGACPGINLQQYSKINKQLHPKTLTRPSMHAYSIIHTPMFQVRVLEAPCLVQLGPSPAWSWAEPSQEISFHQVEASWLLALLRCDLSDKRESTRNDLVAFHKHCLVPRSSVIGDNWMIY